MYAIVETGGRQYRVENGMQIIVDRTADEVGAEIQLDRVLLVAGEDLKVGHPLVEGAAVKAKVVSHSRGDKVIAYKYRRRKRSRRRVGFRSSLTTLEILSIES